MRTAKPWLRKSTGTWYVQIDGRQVPRTRETEANRNIIPSWPAGGTAASVAWTSCSTSSGARRAKPEARRVPALQAYIGDLDRQHPQQAGA